ncbi:MAG: ABC transporter substrate-binding protein [Rhodospirillales bacterium]|nr:ABC transporter substrate-binding protein [Rhodospirillales bacterium]
MAGASADAAAQAAAFIREAGNELAAIVDRPDPPAARRRRLGPFLDRVVDVPAVGRFCLGRFWRRASPAQQSDYEVLFHAILLDSVMARVGDYRQPQAQGMRVVIGRPEPNGGTILVPTTVRRAGAPAAHVVWVVRAEPGGMRIVDLVAEGTSLRITVRADYASFLNQHDDSIPALLAAMRRQITAATQGAAR